MTQDRYARAMEDAQPSYSAVRLLDPADESRVIGIISTEALRARKPNRPDLAPVVIRPRRDPLPTVAPRTRTRTEHD